MAQLWHSAMPLKWCKCYWCGDDGIITNNRKIAFFYCSIDDVLSFIGSSNECTDAMNYIVLVMWYYWHILIWKLHKSFVTTQMSVIIAQMVSDSNIFKHWTSIKFF